MRVLSVTAGVLLMAASAQAQPPTPGQPTTITVQLNRGYAGLKANFTEMGAKMTDADYAFKPGPAPELRNFGQLLGHLANAQFGSCAAMLGQPNPNQGHNLEMELKTRAEFIKAMNDSFALCDKAFAALTEQNKDELVAQGQGQIARSALLTGVVVHGNEMYGTASVYLRAKGLVPPSTERAQRARGAAPAAAPAPAPGR